MNKKIALPIVVSIFILSFVILSVLVYMRSTTGSPKEVNVSLNGNGTRFYGCTVYSHTVTHSTHCDPLMNKLAGYVFPGNQSLIYTDSGTPTFVEGKHGLGLGLVANKREGVELANSSGLNQSKFSLSFWVKDAKHPEQYGVIISHYNRNSSAGWSVDAYSN